MLPSILDQIAGIARQREHDAWRAQCEITADRKRRAEPKAPPKPRPKVREKEYIAATLRRIKDFPPEFRAKDLVAAMPEAARSDDYRYVNAMLDQGLIVRVKTGWYRRAA